MVTMVGDRAYKLMKPVATGFLDHRRREDRRTACLRETAVNRRFAPDVYLGVLDVVDGNGAPLDHLVEMRRLPAGRALSRRLDDPGAADHVAEVARAVAALHREAPTGRAIARAGLPATVAGLWREGLEGIARDAPGVIAPEAVSRARSLAHEYVTGRRALFERRIAEGWVRDGHGDLLADDVYLLDDGPRVLDCLAFDDRLRHGDVLLDVAFLAMDLESRGRPHLAGELMREWAAGLDESHPRSLEHHYVAYRAHVRSKVAAIRATQGDPAAAAEARRLHDMALAQLERGRVRLVLVGGLPGTGKSTLAEELGRMTGARVLRSDVVRKRLAGLPVAAGAPAPFGEGLYAPARTAEVYRDMLDRAGPLLSHGETVVLDASWSAEARRREARALAHARGALLVELRCEAPGGVTVARMARRAAEGGDPSDASPSVAAAMAAAADPWAGAATIDTTRPIDEVAVAARRTIDPGTA